jgi:hypothetical protein
VPTRLLLGLGLVGGIWVLGVGDAAAGPLDGVPLPVTTPTVPRVGSVTDALPLPPPVDSVADAVTAPVDNTVQTVSGTVTGAVSGPAPTPPPAVAPAAPPAAAAPTPAPGAGAGPAAAVTPPIDAGAAAALLAGAPTPLGPTVSDVAHGRIDPAPTGLRAVLDATRSSTVLFLLVGAALVFLAVQDRLDRRSPQLADAPVDRRAEMLEFS